MKRTKRRQPAPGSRCRFGVGLLAQATGVLSMLWAAGALGEPPVLPSVTTAPPISDGVFVKTKGGDFVLSDKPFRFVGANIDPLHGPEKRGAVRAMFSALAQDGLSVARVWALGEGPKTSSAWEREHVLFRIGPTDFVEAGYSQVDLVLAEARRAGVRVIVTLSNHWPDYGGAPMVLKWLGLPHTGQAQEAFYADERAHALYRAHVGRLLVRVNSLTGVRYRDDPTIFAWELMNESTVDTPAGRAARLAWVREMSRFVKTFDHNHLVAAGHGGYALMSDRQDFIAVHQLPNIDYVDGHLYLQNSAWGISPKRLYDLLDDRAYIARWLVGKPLVIGEFGFRTDQGPNYLGWPRARWFSEVLSRHFGNRGGGALVWIYEPWSGKPRDYGIYIDRPETDDVREAMRQGARLFAQGRLPPDNPRFSAQLGTKPLYEVNQVVHGVPVSRGQLGPDQTFTLRFSPGAFHTARFERLGVWPGPPVEHFYGAESGDLSFRFRLPTKRPFPLGEVTVWARLSSEWPGAEAPKDGDSLVYVLLDDVLLAKQSVIADNGLGAIYRFHLQDPVQLRALSASPPGTEHTLRFVVPPGPKAHGLCLYGETKDPALPKAEFQPLQIRLVPPARFPKEKGGPK